MRTEGDLIKINDWLLPLSWLYGIVVGVRNYLFEIGVLRQRSFDIPVISVGNITVGGSGKTPHVEYIVRLLRDIAKVGVLSRGYKRKSHGYVLAHGDTPLNDIGDEPWQMKRKFDDIYMAVDRSRCNGINRLMTDPETNDVDVIVLDDAYQHRYVNPGINILLVDYHRLIIYDKLLPAGRLREPLKGKNRADMVIVTKCPKDLKPMEFRVLTKAMNLFPYQDLFFTCVDYDWLQPVFADCADPVNANKQKPLAFLSKKNVLQVTGIASPEQMENDLRGRCRTITSLKFGDHHFFTPKDVDLINVTFDNLPSPKLVITTEKDASRLINTDGLSPEVKAHIYALPIKVKFLQGQDEAFNTKIIGYVRKNSRNSILVKTKDENKPQDRNHSGDRFRTISFRDN